MYKRQHAFISKAFYDYCRMAEFDKVDGALLTFASSNPAFSYVLFDNNHNAIGTIEKKVASDEAICGAYYFRNKDMFTEAVNRYLINCNYKEFFLSGVYNEMGKIGARISTFKVDEHISFGTPAEYDLAVTNKRLEAIL